MSFWGGGAVYIYIQIHNRKNILSYLSIGSWWGTIKFGIYHSDITHMWKVITLFFVTLIVATMFSLYWPKMSLVGAIHFLNCNFLSYLTQSTKDLPSHKSIKTWFLKQKTFDCLHINKIKCFNSDILEIHFFKSCLGFADMRIINNIQLQM